MATATLEKPISRITDMYEHLEVDQFSEDEIHNAHIEENWRKLITEDNYENQALAEQDENCLVEEVTQYGYDDVSDYESEDAEEETAYDFPIDSGARASSYLFNADSPVNQKFMNDSIVRDVRKEFVVEETENLMSAVSEEESADLRPTATTIQYKDGTHSEDAVREQKRDGIFAMSESKKRRLLFGGLIAVLFALVVMVIVNSAVISHLSKSIETAQMSESEIITYSDENVNSDIADIEIIP